MTDISICPTPNQTPSRSPLEYDKPVFSFDKLETLPCVTVDYRNLQYTVPVPIKDPGLPSIPKSILKTVLFCKSAPTRDFEAISSMSGRFVPGKMYLLLAPPGHGKSLFLKAIAGRLSEDPYFKGEVLYNGLNKDKISEAGLRAEKLCAYVEQVDIHMPILTVKETLEFSVSNSVLCHSDEEKHKRVETYTKLLGLEECSNVIAGNQMLRGISGGQRRRLTLGEMLVTNARVLCLDEITTGLDSAVAYRVLAAIREWCVSTGGIVLTSLLQPTPEVFNLFDDLLLFRHGECVYNGPRESALQFVEELGLELPPNTDVADFLNDFLSQPAIVYHRQVERNGPREPSPPITTLALREAFRRSEYYRNEYPPTQNSVEMSDFIRKQYGTAYTYSVMKHVWLCLARQLTLLKRNKGLIGPRISQAIIISLVLGSLYFNAGKVEYNKRMGLILFMCIYLAFSNMVEIPWAAEAKNVVYKQCDANFYPAFAHNLAVIVTHFLLVIPETFIFGTITYFMTGFTYEVDRWLFYILAAFALNIGMSVIFRFLCYIFRNPDIAQNMSSPFIGNAVVFGGFMITYAKIPDWLKWLYWISPFSWIVRSIGQNEFFADRYSDLIGDPKIKSGIAYLQAWEMQTDAGYKWAGIGFMAAIFFGFAIFCGVALTFVRYPLCIGTRRIEEKDEEAQPPSKAFNISSLPFQPMDVVFKTIGYTVQVQGEKGQTVDKVLLQNISGYAKSGTLTALMGSSGAGKTTLMDVIAGRKTTGTIVGDILINGKPKDKRSFNRITGYVEQTDVHMGTQTVREALLFSAKLRLPAEVSEDSRIQFVNEVLSLLELDEIADRLVGDDVIISLSPGQRKRVTIGVELVANPAILFLDEPTSGLDSRQAAVVMRTVRRIASTGRAVLCTIHQPSADLFNMFDRLLLLQPGGRVAYFGDLDNLVSYFENAPVPHGVPQPVLPPQTNPASWMLEVLETTNFSELYYNSVLFQHNNTSIEELSNKPGFEMPRYDSPYASSSSKQFISVVSRLFVSYWRDTDYNIFRLLLSTITSILFGLIYLSIDDNSQAGLTSKLSGIFLSIGFGSVLNCATSLPTVSRNREVFYREKASYSYSSFAYSTSLALVELPYVFLNAVLFVTPFYFLMGLKADAAIYFQHLFLQFLCSYIFSCWGQFLVCAFPDIITANIVMGGSFNFIFLFGGVFIRAAEIPWGWRWMYYIWPIPKAFIPMATNQYDCSSNCPTVSTFNGGIETKKDFVSRYVDSGYGVMGQYVGWMILTIVILRLAIALILWKVNHQKR